MYEQRRVRASIALAGAAVLFCLTGALVSGQRAGPEEAAAKLSGTWKLNRELSPSVSGPGRGRPGGPGRGAPAYATSGAPVFAAQRGGGRGGGGDMSSASSSADLPPDVIAAQAAMRDLQQIAEVITITATPASIGFSDPRGEQTYATDNKTAKVEVGATRLDVKTRWDKLAVRQEFSSPQMRLIRSWEVDGENHLVLRVKVESLTLNSKEVKAVYDRQ